MKFYLWMKQQGEGCDYTIGCAEKLVELEGANDVNQARKRASDVLKDYGIDGEERALDTALILSFVESASPQVEAHCAARANARATADVMRKRAELERLKRELGED